MTKSRTKTQPIPTVVLTTPRIGMGGSDQIKQCEDSIKALTKELEAMGTNIQKLIEQHNNLDDVFSTVVKQLIDNRIIQ